MSDLSTSTSAPSPATNRVTPAPVTAGQSGQPQTPAHGGPQSGTGGHVDLPHDTAVTLSPTLAGLEEGDRIALQVLANDAAGRQVLQAQNSVLVTLEPESLPHSATVHVRVVSLSNDHLRAALLSVDGKPVDTPHAIRLRVVELTFPQSTVEAPEKTTPPLRTPTSTAPTALPVGSVVHGRFLLAAEPPIAAQSATQGSIATPGLAANIAPGTVVQWRVVSLMPPVATAVGRPLSHSASPPSSTGGATHPANKAAGQNGAPIQASRATSGHSTVPVSTVVPNQTPRAAQVVGIVAAPAKPDQTIITTATGTVVLAAAARWPDGTTVTLEALDPIRDQPATLTPADPPTAATKPLDQFLMKLDEDWPALRDLTAQAAALAPAATSAFTQTRVPGPDARAAAQIMFFLSVLRTGDIAGWLGNDIVRVLERSGQRGLIDRLGDDFRQLRRLGDESGASDWRLLLFPFAGGEKIEPIHLFVRGQRREQQDDHDLRFVVDLRMSALGAIQLDGLLRGRRFDLIVRSHSDLDDNRRQSITEIFGSGLAVIGYQGGIGFQAVKEFPLSPFNDLLGHRHTPGAVVA